MAGDWIKMRLDLQTHPKVVRILSATKADKFRAIGGLHAVWSVFDTHSADGKLDGYTPETLDHIIGWPGFADAMIAVGWLAFDGAETLMLPEFDEHNGKSGKRRAEDQKRKRNDRKIPQSVQNLSGESADKNGTREEKRREEKKESKNKVAPLALPDWLPLDAWAGYLEMRKRNKKSPTDRAIELLLKALEGMRNNGQDIAAVLDKSTQNNWTDVYAIRDERRTVPRHADSQNDIYAQNRAAVERMTAGMDEGQDEDFGQG